MHKNKLKQHTHTLYLLLLKSVMISIICDCVLQGERFQWAMQLRPGWLSKFMPTVSYMRPPFKYHSKLAKSIASIDLKTKPCGCTKTKTTHTCTLPFDVKICNDQYIMWLCVLQLTGREVSMSDAIKTRLIINLYAHCTCTSYMRPPFKYHSKLAKSNASIDLKTKPCGCTKTKNNTHIHSTFWC